MATFVSDTFTDADTTTLQSHTGETGATWTKLSGGDILITSNRADPPASEAIYKASGTPGAAEYDVSADMFTNSTSGWDSGVLGRCADANNFYLAAHDSTVPRWHLYKRVSGTYTQLGTYSQTLSASTTYALKLEIRDAAKKVFIDTVERISSADNALTAAGNAGIRTNLTNLNVDNFLAATVGGSDVSVALTGSALTLATGTLAPSTSVPLVGSALAASAGTLTPALALALAGSGLTAATGTLSPATSVALTGSALTVSTGTLSPALSVALTGAALSVVAGTLTATGGDAGNVTVALTGQSLTISAGTLTPALSVALSGSALSASTGTLAPSLAVALTGAALSVVAGTLTATGGEPVTPTVHTATGTWAVPSRTGTWEVPSRTGTWAVPSD